MSVVAASLKWAKIGFSLEGRTPDSDCGLLEPFALLSSRGLETFGPAII